MYNFNLLSIILKNVFNCILRSWSLDKKNLRQEVMPLPYSLVLNQSSLKSALKLFDLFLITFVRKIGKNINGRKKQSDNKINKECNF